MLSIYSLQSGHFQLSYNEDTGLRRRKRFRSMAEAEKAKVAIEQAQRRGNGVCTETVQRLMKLHLEKCPYSKVQRRQKVFELFMAHFGKMPLHEVTTNELWNWIEYEKQRSDWSYKTMREWCTQLHQFFDFLVAERLVATSPLRQIKFPYRIPLKRKRVTLATEEIKAILANAKAWSPDFLYPLFYTYVHTGARRSELTKLLWKNVDFKLGRITFLETKNGRERMIRIPPQVLKLLQSMPKRSAYVFTNERGLPISDPLLQRRHNEFKARFPNGKNWCFHAFRHSFAHEFLRKKGQMYELQAILGHRHIEMTIDLYGQLQASDIEKPSPWDF